MNRQIELLEQAEATVLGGALSSEAYAAQAIGRLDEADFRNEAHRTMYRAIAACARQGRHGTVEVTSWLIDAGPDTLDAAGGPVAVSTLASRNVSPDVYRDRIARVASARRRRKLLEGATAVAEAAKDWQTTDAELRQLALTTLLDVEATSDAAEVVTVADRRVKLTEILKAGTSSRAVTTGWRNLDRHYKVSPGRWTLVGGVPGHGKSSFLDALLHNLASIHGWRTLVCSPEKQPLELHMAQLVQARLGRPILDGRGAAEGDDVDAAVAWVDEHFAWLELGEGGRDVASLLALSRMEHVRKRFDGLVIDPWNELDHARDRNLSETEHISQSLTRIRDFARKLDVHVWLVAHPTKLRKTGPDDAPYYPVPTPYDVSGSANWRNKADCALAVWRDPNAPKTPSQIHVQKVRFSPDDGVEGMVELRFDPSSGRFYEGSPV